MGALNLETERLNVCVSCGLCLPHCPTYRVTGEEGLSPRGRIDAMRQVEAGGQRTDQAFNHLMSTCVQCRGCEPACPSGVEYGRLISGAREVLASKSTVENRLLRTVLSVLAHRRTLYSGSRVLGVAQRLGLVPDNLMGGKIPAKVGTPVTPTATDRPDVWLFTGCVMDAWYRPVHRSTARVLDAMGVSYGIATAGGGCCGALHEHAGFRAEACSLARDVIASLPGDAPILVNAAGCGAHLKEYGHLLGTDGAHRFAARVFDVHEWIAPRSASLCVRPLDRAVVVQDPCHLRHVQRADGAVRALLEPIVEVIELDDDGLCCGAGGAYSLLEPGLSAEIRYRKVDTIRRAVEAHPGAAVVASANPGCAMHLGAPVEELGMRIVHPIELVAEALG